MEDAEAVTEAVRGGFDADIYDTMMREVKSTLEQNDKKKVSCC